jgi:hypothetical protein
MHDHRDGIDDALAQLHAVGCSIGDTAFFGIEHGGWRYRNRPVKPLLNTRAARAA